MGKYGGGDQQTHFDSFDSWDEWGIGGDSGDDDALGAYGSYAPGQPSAGAAAGWAWGGAYTGSLGRWTGRYWNWTPRQPYLDGSRVLVHDGYDVEQAEYETRSWTELGKEIKARSRDLPTAPALADDLFWSYWKRAVDPSGNAPLRGAYRLHQPLVEMVLSADAYPKLHQITNHDGYLAGKAAAAALRTVTDALSEATQAMMKMLSQLQEQADALSRTASGYELLAEAHPGHPEYAARAQALRDAAQQVEQQIEQLIAQGIPTDELEALRGRLAQEMDPDVEGSAAEGVKDIAESWNAVGGGQWYSKTGAGSGSQRLNDDQKRKIAERLRKDERLKGIARLAGRMKLIAHQIQSKKAPVPSESITSIKMGQDLERLLPEELALLSGDPRLKALFAMRFQEHKLLSYELLGRESLGRGPMILAVDNSGSMDGEPDIWAKAVMLALIQIAQKQKRDIAILHFDTRLAKQGHYLRGVIPPDELMDHLTFFTGGGTYFDPWMKRSLEIVQDSKWNRADVIAITDGITSVDRAVMTKWNDARKLRDMHCYGVLIGRYLIGSELFTTLSDHFIVIDDVRNAMDADSSALQTLFSV